MLAITQSLNLLRDLPCFRFPEASSPNISCFGSLLSSVRMTCPTQRSRIFRIVASMLVDSAMSRTCRLETRSCYLMFRMVRRLRIWKLSSCFRCLLIGCLTSQQHASVSQGRICTDNFTCCHTEIEAADQTFYLTQSQYTDTGPTSPSADPISPGAWQGSHWSANV